MKASSRLAATGSRSTSCPPTRIAPPVGRTMPTMLRKVVVFPAPVGPTSPSTSPGPPLNDKSRTAATAPDPGGGGGGGGAPPQGRRRRPGRIPRRRYDVYPATRIQGAGRDHPRPRRRSWRTGDAHPARPRGAAARGPARTAARRPRHRGDAGVQHRSGGACARGIQATARGETDRGGALKGVTRVRIFMQPAAPDSSLLGGVRDHLRVATLL